MAMAGDGGEAHHADAARAAELVVGGAEREHRTLHEHRCLLAGRQVADMASISSAAD